MRIVGRVQSHPKRLMATGVAAREATGGERAARTMWTPEESYLP